MPALYRIKDWETHYEYPDSKKTLGPLTWVRIQTKQDGSGYRRMVAERDRAELFSGWLLMVEIAARLPKQLRGRLVNSDGRPLDEEDLSLMTGFPTAIFKRALTFFSGPKMAWLIVEQAEPAHPAAPSRDGGAPGESAPATSGDLQTSPEVSGEGRDRVEQSRVEKNTPLPGSPEGGTSPPDKSPAQLRAEGLFRKRPSTPWDRSELVAWKAGRAVVEATPEADWLVMEWWFGLPADKAPFRRKNLATLINNWNGEVVRARSAKGKQGEEPRFKI